MYSGRLRRAIDGLIAANFVIAGLALMAMLAHVVLDVVLREIAVPFSGTLEIVSFWYMVALVFLAIPVAQAQGHHIRVELFTAAVSPRVQRWIDVVVLVACIGILIPFVWVASEEAMRQTRRLAVVEAGTGTIPVWPTRWLVPLSMATTLLVCLFQLLELLGFAEERVSQAPGTEEPFDV